MPQQPRKKNRFYNRRPATGKTLSVQEIKQFKENQKQEAFWRSQGYQVISEMFRKARHRVPKSENEIGLLNKNFKHFSKQDMYQSVGF